jgi:hypothetical protein
MKYFTNPITNIVVNDFIKVILPYQPFKILYLYIDSSGNIYSEQVKDNMIIMLNSNNILLQNNALSIYYVKDGRVSGINAGYYYIRLMETSFVSNFEKSLSIPISLQNFTI